MIFKESETVELKQTLTEDIKKEIIAFANSNGGTIYIGVSDDGSLIGVVNVDETLLQITNMIRDSVKPDITMFVHYDTIDFSDKTIVVITVQQGVQRPYYLVKKGLRSEGVYVRQGTSIAQASDTLIRRLIKESDGDSFEKMRSLEQELTFVSLQSEFEKRRLELGLSQMKSLGILNTDGIYTNLGLLLSDQCSHTIKAAVFEADDQNTFKDRREFQGSLIKQLNEAYEYIDLHNQTHASFDKLLRIDNRDYPQIAVREALLNALVHRDYSFSSSTLVSIYNNSLEFVSIGGLVTGISLDDVLLGLSVCRNVGLANVFYRLGLIEAYGTGIKKILRAYESTGRNAEIETTNNAFKIVLPNLNAPKSKVYTISADDINAKIILYLSNTKNGITRKFVEDKFNVSQSTANRILNTLVENGSITQAGKGKNTVYLLS